MAAYHQSGKLPKLLQDAPELPPCLTYLWSDFLELHQGRGSNGFGPSPIGFHDIDGFQRVTGTKFAAWERAAIRAADNAHFAQLAADK